MGHRVTMRHERPVVNQVSSGPPSHKVGAAQQHFIIKWKWCVCEGPEQALRAQGSPMRKWLRRPRSPRLSSAFSLQPAPMALWGIYFPRIRDRGRQDSGLVCRWLCTICSRTHRRATPGPQPRPGTSPEDPVRGNPPGSRTSGSAPGCALGLEGEVAGCVVIHQFSGCGPWFG